MTVATAIAFRFPGGRYHATPTGRHVNEADVEWPPSPRRILRALIATWHRKVDPEGHPEPVLASLIEALGASLPVYRLPPVVHAHTRHYMPVGALKKGREKTSLIFDAFLRVDPAEELIAAWPGVALQAAERELLALLAHRMSYLGRAESWVEAELQEGWEGEPNAYPSGPSVDLETRETTEPVELLAALTAAGYSAWREETLSRSGIAQKRKPNRTERRLLGSLPPDYLDVLRLDSEDVQQAGWSRAPGSRVVLYRRPLDALRSPPPPASAPAVPAVTSVRLVLAGRPLPRVEDAVRISEVARRTAIRKSEDLHGPEGIPGALSGHDLPDTNRHGHAFYLPEDADEDGHIDHLLVHAPAGLPPAALDALAQMRKLWLGERGEWTVAVEGYGNDPDTVGSSLGGHAAEWTSVTPYLHPWYRKKGFGLPEQIARECRERGLPEPNVQRIDSVRLRGRDRRPVHFHRFRSKRGLRQPDRQGSFLTLTFPRVISGPLALGFGCHFGLGMFRASAGGS